MSSEWFVHKYGALRMSDIERFSFERATDSEISIYAILEDDCEIAIGEGKTFEDCQEFLALVLVKLSRVDEEEDEDDDDDLS